MNAIRRQFSLARYLALALLVLVSIPACSRDERKPETITGAFTDEGIDLNAPAILDQDGSVPPTGLVPIDVGGGGTATIWPYTGESLNGVPSDPINLVFLGKADPVRIRAALLALDGDRTAFGVEIVSAVNSPRVKLLYDIYHMQIMEGDVIRTIRQNHQHIAHYHTGGVPGRHELDETQELQYRAIMTALAERGYQGYVGQEFIPSTGRDPLASLKHGFGVCSI